MIKCIMSEYAHEVQVEDYLRIALFFYPLLLLIGRGDRVGTVILIVRFDVAAITVCVAAITVGVTAITVGGYDCRHMPMQRCVTHIFDMERQHIRRECILNCNTRLHRRRTAHCIAALLPRGSMTGLLPPYRWSLVLGDPQRSTEEISNRRLVGGHGGGRGFVRDINFGICDTRGDNIRQTGQGDGVGHGGVFVFFLCLETFFWMRGRGGGKI